MDVTKVKAAIAAAQTEVNKAISEAVKAAEKTPIEVNGIAPLVKVNTLLERAVERANLAVEKTTPKAKEKKDKGGDKAKK